MCLAVLIYVWLLIYIHLDALGMKFTYRFCIIAKLFNPVS